MNKPSDHDIEAYQVLSDLAVKAAHIASMVPDHAFPTFYSTSELMSSVCQKPTDRDVVELTLRVTRAYETYRASVIALEDDLRSIYKMAQNEKEAGPGDG